MGKAPQQTVIQQAPVAAPAPPVTPNAAEVVQAGMDLRQQEMLKKNIRSTVKAGDTGGFKAAGAGKLAAPVGGNPFVSPQGKF